MTEQPQPAPDGIVWKTPELARRFAQLQRLAKVNQQLEQELQQIGRRYGGQAGLDPYSILNMRFQLLLDIIWPADTEEGQANRMAHDEAFQRLLTSSLEAAKQQVGMQALAMGAQIPPDQMDKLAQQVPSGLARAPERRTRT